VNEPDTGQDGHSEQRRFFVEEANLLLAAVLHVAKEEGMADKDLNAVIEQAIIEAPSEDMARELRRFLTKKEDN
jgi:hypothetical protein